MEFVLVEEDASRAKALAGALAAGVHAVSVMGADAVGRDGLDAGGAACSAILLGFDRPTRATVRALHRLWSAPGIPPCYFVTSPRSRGEALLSSVTQMAPDPAMRTRAPDLRCRTLKSLSMERLLALDRVVTSERSGHR